MLERRERRVPSLGGTSEASRFEGKCLLHGSLANQCRRTTGRATDHLRWNFCGYCPLGANQCQIGNYPCCSRRLYLVGYESFAGR